MLRCVLLLQFEPISIIVFARCVARAIPSVSLAGPFGVLMTRVLCLRRVHSFMGMASLQIIISSIQDIMAKVTESDPKVEMQLSTWIILGIVVATKLTLFMLCRGFREESDSMDALAQVRKHVHGAVLSPAVPCLTVLPMADLSVLRAVRRTILTTCAPTR